jgi:hypothetical protein
MLPNVAAEITLLSPSFFRICSINSIFFLYINRE